MSNPKNQCSCPNCGSLNTSCVLKKRNTSVIKILKTIGLMAIILLIACNLHTLTIDIKAVTTSRETANKIMLIRGAIIFIAFLYVIAEITQQIVESIPIKHYTCQDCKHEFEYDN